MNIKFKDNVSKSVIDEKAFNEILDVLKKYDIDVIKNKYVLFEIKEIDYGQNVINGLIDTSDILNYAKYLIDNDKKVDIRSKEFRTECFLFNKIKADCIETMIDYFERNTDKYELERKIKECYYPHLRQKEREKFINNRECELFNRLYFKDNDFYNIRDTGLFWDTISSELGKYRQLKRK